MCEQGLVRRARERYESYNNFGQNGLSLGKRPSGKFPTQSLHTLYCMSPPACAIGDTVAYITEAPVCNLLAGICREAFDFYRLHQGTCVKRHLAHQVYYRLPCGIFVAMSQLPSYSSTGRIPSMWAGHSLLQLHTTPRLHRVWNSLPRRRARQARRNRGYGRCLGPDAGRRDL